MVAASRPHAAELAGRCGDAMINTDVDEDLIQRFEGAGGRDCPRFVEQGVCWATDERQARRTAHEIWPLSALGGPLFTELSLPSHFEAAFAPITEEAVAEAIICGPDAARHVAAIREAERTGYTHFCVHQIGPEQERFIAFYEREVLPVFDQGRRRRPRKANAEAAGLVRRSTARARARR
jgi:G6PDH family F420-dependent oxidoreductase